MHDNANSNAGPLTTPLTCDINLIELSSIVRVICCNKDSDSSISFALLKILFNCNSVLKFPIILMSFVLLSWVSFCNISLRPLNELKSKDFPLI